MPHHFHILKDIDCLYDKIYMFNQYTFIMSLAFNFCIIKSNTNMHVALCYKYNYGYFHDLK